MFVSTRGGQNTCWPFPYVLQTGGAWAKHQIWTRVTVNKIKKRNTFRCRADTDKKVLAYLDFCLKVKTWIQVTKYTFSVSGSTKTKTWRTGKYVLYVTKSLSFSLFFQVSFFTKAYFVEPAAPSFCLLSFFHPLSSFSLSLSLFLSLLWYSLVCQACNRAAIVWTRKQQELYPC